ncbi:hypothetical protein AN958_05942 [Leucoagaricus sp. SymC.cos]|nr:hypothetical protein AN958_05942 [Leucoagaricus sp. SymC.cos]
MPNLALKAANAALNDSELFLVRAERFNRRSEECGQLIHFVRRSISEDYEETSQVRVYGRKTGDCDQSGPEGGLLVVWKRRESQVTEEAKVET